ncbi:hypothetical protein LTS18_001009, partial [Coniosporium uncinatum]
MLGHDREHVNLPLVVLFVKTFSWDVLGVKVAAAEGRKPLTEDGVAEKSKEDGASTEEEGPVPEDSPLISTELRQRFKSILTRYFEDVKAHISKDQKTLAAQSRRNAEAYVRSGEVFEDRQANFEKQMKAQEKLVSNAQVLADAVGAEMPDLKEKDDTNALGDGGIGLVKTGEYLRGQGDGPGIWEDEDERRFYESLVDLKDRVPGILLEDGKKKKTDTEEPVGKKVAEVDSKTADSVEAVADAGSKLANGEDQSTAIANKSVGAQVDSL